ncbi:MAG: c-type cytochrome [Gemmatimonadaceae bacterium]
MKWLARIGAGIAGLILLCVIGIYVASTVVLHRTYQVPLPKVVADSDSASVAHGRELATTAGCRGCHEADLSGKVFMEAPFVGRLVAPNLTKVVEAADDADLARRIRDGIRPDGRSLMGMPSEMYYHLSDGDIADLIGYLRSAPPREDSLPSTSYGLLGRVGILLGEYPSARDLIDPSVPRVGSDSLYLTRRRGEYLVRTSCPECHGPALEGDGMLTPTLAGAAGYNEDEFVHFVRTGEARGGRQIDSLMIKVALYRLSHFSDEDLREIHRYLTQYVIPDGTTAH